jgi:glycosyltransferase involved in cell wall biosynthesis
LEALNRGVPVICLDHQGVGDVITDQCGIKISVTSPKEVVAGLRDAIVRLVNDRERLETLSKGAIDRSKQYLWENKGIQMAAIYEAVLEKARGRLS